MPRIVPKVATKPSAPAPILSLATPSVAALNGSESASASTTAGRWP
jgi:hypothetical protein